MSWSNRSPESRLHSGARRDAERMGRDQGNEPQHVECNGVVIRETEKAVLVVVEQWIPKKLLQAVVYAPSDGRPLERTAEIRVGKKFRGLVLPWWLARAKGLIRERDDK